MDDSGAARRGAAADPIRSDRRDGGWRWTHGRSLLVAAHRPSSTSPPHPRPPSLDGGGCRAWQRTALHCTALHRIVVAVQPSQAKAQAASPILRTAQTKAISMAIHIDDRQINETAIVWKMNSETNVVPSPMEESTMWVSPRVCQAKRRTRCARLISHARDVAAHLLREYNHCDCNGIRRGLARANRNQAP